MVCFSSGPQFICFSDPCKVMLNGLKLCLTGLFNLLKFATIVLISLVCCQSKLSLLGFRLLWLLSFVLLKSLKSTWFSADTFITVLDPGAKQKSSVRKAVSRSVFNLATQFYLLVSSLLFSQCGTAQKTEHENQVASTFNCCSSNSILCRHEFPPSCLTVSSLSSGGSGSSK